MQVTVKTERVAAAASASESGPAPKQKAEKSGTAEEEGPGLETCRNYRPPAESASVQSVVLKVCGHERKLALESLESDIRPEERLAMWRGKGMLQVPESLSRR